MEKIKRIEEIFANLYNADTDWSAAADMFIKWNVDKDFKTESFASFVDWIDDDDLNNTWHFFFGYSDNFEKFADDWVDEDEVEDYLKFCENR